MVGELEKSQQILVAQKKINNEFVKEIHLIQTKLEEDKTEYDGNMLKYAQLLDIRAAQIRVIP